MAHAIDDGGKSHRAIIIKVFIFLALITAAEFVIAFAMDRSMMRNIIFILLTLIKAGGIIAEFMHMRYEVKGLIYTLTLPLIFVIWFIIALLVEGSWYNGGWLRFLTV